MTYDFLESNLLCVIGHWADRLIKKCVILDLAEKSVFIRRHPPCPPIAFVLSLLIHHIKFTQK